MKSDRALENRKSDSNPSNKHNNKNSVRGHWWPVSRSTKYYDNSRRRRRCSWRPRVASTSFGGDLDILKVTGVYDWVSLLSLVDTDRVTARWRRNRTLRIQDTSDPQNSYRSVRTLIIYNLIYCGHGRNSIGSVPMTDVSYWFDNVSFELSVSNIRHTDWLDSSEFAHENAMMLMIRVARHLVRISSREGRYY